jgi:hypothetical protein
MEQAAQQTSEAQDSEAEMCSDDALPWDENPDLGDENTDLAQP